MIHHLSRENHSKEVIRVDVVVPENEPYADNWFQVRVKGKFTNLLDLDAALRGESITVTIEPQKGIRTLNARLVLFPVGGRPVVHLAVQDPDDGRWKSKAWGAWNAEIEAGVLEVIYSGG